MTVKLVQKLANKPVLLNNKLDEDVLMEQTKQNKHGSFFARYLLLLYSI